MIDNHIKQNEKEEFTLTTVYISNYKYENMNCF